MKEDHHIKSLLKKFISEDCTREEIEEILRYFKKNDLSQELPSVEEVKRWLNTSHHLEETVADQIFEKVISTPQTQKYRSLNGRYVGIRKYAAVIAVLLLASGYFYRHGITSWINSNWIVNEETIAGDEGAITLELDNGQIKVIDPNGQWDVFDASGNVVGQQNKNRLTYEGGEEVEELIYNTLKVPYGKRFEVQLSDGTSVHLNSGTSLKYPVKFIESEEFRTVYVTGEVYLDVAKNEDKPFIVNTGEMDIRVLGTKFNVSTYPEDEITDVVLVEGLVRLDRKEKGENTQNSILEPGYKASYNRADNTILKQEVPTSIYTSWLQGELVFRNMSFQNILRKLERHYDITIINNNKDLANEKFNASFGDEPVEKVMNYLKKIYGMDFTIKNNTVIIH